MRRRGRKIDCNAVRHHRENTPRFDSQAIEPAGSKKTISG